MSNPYTPGETEAIAEFPQSSHEAIKDVETAKKLYKASRIIKLYAFLNFFGVLLMLLVFGYSLATDMSGTGDPLFRWLFPVFALIMTGIQALFFYSLANRPSWGRICIIVIGSLSLLNIPIGTILGAFIIWAAVVGKELFGEDRIPHDELKQLAKNGLPA